MMLDFQFWMLIGLELFEGLILIKLMLTYTILAGDRGRGLAFLIN